MSPGAHHDELSAEDRAGHFAAKYNLSDDVRKELQKEMSAIERDSSKEQAHHGHHDEPPTMQIFKATIQRQQWGEPEPELFEITAALRPIGPVMVDLAARKAPRAVRPTPMPAARVTELNLPADHLEVLRADRVRAIPEPEPADLVPMLADLADEDCGHSWRTWRIRPT